MLFYSIYLLALITKVSGHGLMESPRSRNQICGVETKPDDVQNGGGATPECADAFNFQGGGYQFMSVLTLDFGRDYVTPLPEHVCGFGSDRWNGGPTPWDAPMDWPTTDMSPGRNEIVWNIQWGPHFSDSQDFKYWITKEDFVFDPTKSLTWDDFEEAPFCDLGYSDANPNGEPDVIPLSDSAQFRTFCDVPSRAGHHVIYGEWGRTPPTKERFHGCIDIMMDGEPVDPFVPAARIRLDPRGNDFIGSGSISLDASSSSGGELSYTWSFSSEGEDGVYTLSDSTSSTATLFLADPSAVQRVTVSLTVTNTEGSSTTHSIILHIPSSIGSIWQDFGPVADGGYTPLDVGTSVSILTVDVNGAEVYYPSPPLVVDGSNNGMWNWPVSLSQSLSGSPVAVGVLDPTTEQITPQYSNTANRIYAHVGYGFTLAQTTFNGAGNPLPPPTSAPVDSPPSPMPVDPPTGSPVVVADPPTAAPVVPMDPPSAAPVASPPSGGGPGVEPSCVVHVRSDINPWHGGMDIGFDVNSVILDFTNTGLDLSLVSVQQGSFTSLTINGNKMTVVKPSWASSTTLVYLGMGGNNVPGLGSFTAPACLTA